MRNNIRGVDGTPIQRIRRHAPARDVELFTEKEIKSITKPPTPLVRTLSLFMRRCIIFIKKYYKHSLKYFSKSTITDTTYIVQKATKIFPVLYSLLKSTLRKKIVMTIIGLLLIFVVYSLIQNRQTSPNTPTKSQSYSAQKDTLPKGNPSYGTITPDGKSPVNGWSRVSPETSDPVYAYADRIDSVSIIVSQQPLPKDFTSDTKNKVRDLATNYSAGEHLTIDNTDVYIGKSSNGQQSVVLTKSNLLILIKTNNTIDTGKILQYIESLK